MLLTCYHARVRWIAENYTVLALYASVSAFAWYYDTRAGMALVLGLPLAFVMGRESMRRHR